MTTNNNSTADDFAIPIRHRQVVYTAPPAAGLPPDPATTFEIVTVPTPQPDDLADGEVLVANGNLSVDPYHRFGLYDPTVPHSGFAPTPIGTVIGTYGTGKVIASANPKFPVGATVYGWFRWEEITRVGVGDIPYLELIDPTHDPVWYLGPLGTPGLVAFAGLTQIARPKAGETILVPATQGGVGSLAAQLARHWGLRVVGTAGSDEKAEALRGNFRLDAVINHGRPGTLADQLREACPDGIDIYFELVGGEMLEAAIANLNDGARVPAAGMVSQYNVAPDKRYGIRNLERLVGMAVTIQTFRNSDYENLLPEMRRTVAPLLANDEVRFTTHVSQGIETIPDAFQDIFSGDATGKRIVAP